jgi:uncharacterized membrane protein YdjX (TVP38/TMEM64 family)|tara:strand:- start:3527 stop:4147 length:621 start_codon:yes stop_codon:yes gene_type:complete
MFSEKTKSFIGLLIILGLFILSSYLVRENIDLIKGLIGNDFLGILIYILITITAIVIAPISMMPLIPVASNIWGRIPTAIILIFGWTLGSIIVFYISRKYGVPLIKKFVSLEKINKLESKIPKENLFLDILLLRMIIPVDILSYALGLFSKVKFKTYFLATIIGLIPFAFIFSYLGTIPFYYQILGFFVVGLIITLIHEFYKKKRN